METIMAQEGPSVLARQLWGEPTSIITTRPHCTPFSLPSNGVLSLGSTVITMTADAVFSPECTGTTSDGDTNVFQTWREPFYSSTLPMTFVLAACFIIAWFLVLMLTITTRTSFFGSPLTAPGFHSGHGIIGGANGGSASTISAGSRPWLQKVATLTVAISLTIATVDTFRVANRQYEHGYLNALLLRKLVLDSKEIRVTRVISDVFLWLAQVQTLIRLFPRHREKVLIKWIGFGLIILDSVFSCLNSFHYENITDGRHFDAAVPALCYLFELAVGLLYAAWVIFYAVTKHRYAFYHPKMRSICLIALLSLIAVLIPIVFFITDVLDQDVGSWGDYVRWVGATAASVVVWEWVERIEALERDEKKDGILGREIFDGDEMLDIDPSEDAVWSRDRESRAIFRRRGDGRGHDHGGDLAAADAAEAGLVRHMAQRFRPRRSQALAHFPMGRAHTTSDLTHTEDSTSGAPDIAFADLARPERTHDVHAPIGLRPPPQVTSPVSRTDTSSAASTIYVLQHDMRTHMPEPVRRRPGLSALQSYTQPPAIRIHGDNNKKSPIEVTEEPVSNRRDRAEGRWHSVAHPFKRKRLSPPQEVQQAISLAPQRAVTPAHNFSRWDIKNQLGVLAAEAGDRYRHRAAPRQPVGHLPVTVIPVQPRNIGQSWSPAIIEETAEETLETSPSPPPGSSSLPLTHTHHPARSGDFSPSPTPSSSRSGQPSRRNTASDRPNDRQAYSMSSPTPSPSLSPSTFPSRPRASSPRGSDGGDRPAPSVISAPPRADDISPAAGRPGGTVVVPAPKRR